MKKIHDKYNPIGFNIRTANKNLDLAKQGKVGILKWLVTSKSFWLNVFLLGAILFVALVPGTCFGGEQGNFFGNDSGASMIARWGVLIPSVTLFVGSIYVGYTRWDMLKHSTDETDYITKVQHSKATGNMLIITTLSIVVAFLYVLMAGYTRDNAAGVIEHGKMTYSVLGGLCLTALVVVPSMFYSFKFAREYESIINKEKAEAQLPETSPKTDSQGSKSVEIRRRLLRSMRL